MAIKNKEFYYGDKERNGQSLAWMPIVLIALLLLGGSYLLYTNRAANNTQTPSGLAPGIGGGPGNSASSPTPSTNPPTPTSTMTPTPTSTPPPMQIQTVTPTSAPSMRY